MTELIRYDAACRAVAEVRTADEAMAIRDQADQMRLYARQAKNRELEVDAAEIRMRAERRLGELIKAQKETVGLRGPQHSTGGGSKGSARAPLPDAPPTLADAGIDRKLSMRAQRVAKIPAAEFEDIITDWRSRIIIENDRVTTNILRAAEKAEHRETVKNPVDGGCTVKDLFALIRAGRKFGTVYADPPWLYDNQGTRAATSNHYGGMTVDELCALPIKELSADDAHLHLWTTNAFLFECPKIFDAWGFEFKGSFVWVKTKIGIGNYWRNSHEFLLTAIRGDAKRFRDHSLKSWIECDRGKHSSKPEKVRHMIEAASPPPFLELFARNAANSWSTWGHEANADLLHQHIPEFVE